MSGAETPQQKAAREKKEAEDERRRQQLELQNQKDQDKEDKEGNVNDDSSNSQINDTSVISKGKKEKRGISDDEEQDDDLMDGVAPFGDGKGITGKKRGFMSIDEQVSKLTQRYLKGELTDDNYLAIINAVRGNGQNGGKTSKGTKSRRGNTKRSSAVCYPFFLSFLFFLSIECWSCLCVMLVLVCY